MPDATVAGRFWLDQNADWQQDADEPGVEGVLVEMLADDAVVASGYDHFTYRASAAGLVSLQPAVVNLVVMRLGVGVEGADVQTKIGYVPINGNNDNGSKLVNTALIPQSAGIPTVRDYASLAKMDQADPELKRVLVTADPIFLPGIYVVSTSASGTAKIRLWEDAKKTRMLGGGTGTGGTFTQATLPREFWVEGLEMTSMTSDPDGEPRVRPDAGITVTYIRPTVVETPQGLIVVPMPRASARADVIVTPVVQSFKLIPGIVRAVEETIGTAKITTGLQAGSYIPPGGQAKSLAGAQMLGTLMRRAVPGDPTLVQIAGYGATQPIVNGIPGFDKFGATSQVGMQTQTRNMVFVENSNLLPTSAKNQIRSYQQILDAGARWIEAGGTGEPTAPDYVGTTVTATGNDAVTVEGQDFPGVIVQPLTLQENVTFAAGLVRMAIRFNFRLHLLWKFPARNGGPSILFPLARLDWTVYFHGVPDGATGRLVPAADSKVTATGFVLNHDTPGVLAKPDFNLHASLR